MEKDGLGVHPQPNARPARRLEERDDDAAESDGVSVVDTTEVRWFAPGRPPAEVMAWFTHDGTIGMVEKRCDTYRISDRYDVGLKCRHREIPELKIRRSLAGRYRRVYR